MYTLLCVTAPTSESIVESRWVDVEMTNDFCLREPNEIFGINIRRAKYHKIVSNTILHERDPNFSDHRHR
jgi:hypothetical protein